MTLADTPIDRALTPILTSILSDNNLLYYFPRSYGRLPVEAIKGVDATGKKTDKPRRLPLFYDEARKTAVPVLPDEQAGGMLSFVTTGPSRPVSPVAGWAVSERSQVKEYPVALLAWWVTHPAYPSADSVRRSLEIAVGKRYDWVTTSVDDQLATRVFRDIDYDFDNHRYLLFPFAGLRIEGTLTLTESVC